MFSVVTLCWTLHPFYTLIQKSKATEKGGSAENEYQTASKHGNACQRENQNWLGETHILTGQQSPCGDQKIVCINRG